MAATNKKLPVKLAVPSKFLATLPVFAAPPTPKPKTRVKKLTSEEKKNGSSPGASTGSKGSSPAPADDGHTPKVNTGPKEMSTAGLSVNNIAQLLDKSGEPCKRWVRGGKQFKSFSGFKIKLKRWVPEQDQADVKDEIFDAPSSPFEPEPALSLVSGAPIVGA